MNERMRFVAAVLQEEDSFADLCVQFGVSRKTGYKWMARFDAEGPPGMTNRSRAPKHSPHAVSEAVEAAVLALRRRHPRWGPDKLLVKLEERMPELVLPSRSTVARIVKRHGLVRERRRRRHASPTPLTDSTAANAVWSIDYKGQFRMGNGQLCYPLTLCDHYTRYLLCCQGCGAIRLAGVGALMERVFRDYGLPDVIRSDNGVPFASTGLRGLNRLNITWIKLGIRPERIAPGHPEQNGRHERMHRELKAETASPPKTTLASQQRAFNRFRREYNDDRPHQALGMQTPSSLYSPSPRSWPRRLPEVAYSKGYTIRVICAGGNLRWCGDKHFVSQALACEPVGLNEVDDGFWAVHFGPVLLGHLDERGKTTQFRPYTQKKAKAGEGSPRGALTGLQPTTHRRKL